MTKALMTQSHKELLQRYADLIVPLLDQERLEELATEAILANCEDLTDEELLREIQELEDE